MTEVEFDSLEIGDVVLFGKRKTPRIVRKVSISGNNRSIYYGKKFSIYFAIKKCSWTHRPYTLYNRHEVIALCEYTGLKANLSDWERGVFSWETRNTGPAKVTCCDVKGYY